MGDVPPFDALVGHLARVADALEAVARALAAVAAIRPAPADCRAGDGNGAAPWAAVRCDDEGELNRFCRRANLSVRSRKVLCRAARVRRAATLDKLAAMTADEWMRFPNCGYVTVRELRDFFDAGPPTDAPPPGRAGNADTFEGGD